MRANQFLCFNNDRISGKVLAAVKCKQAIPREFGSVAVESLFIAAHIVCGRYVFVPCFVMQYLVFLLVLQSPR